MISESSNSLAYSGHMTAAKSKLESVTKEAAQALAELTILREAIVKPTVQNSESTLREKNPDASKKFREVYEQELEKLRAEQQQ